MKKERLQKLALYMLGLLSPVYLLLIKGTSVVVVLSIVVVIIFMLFGIGGGKIKINLKRIDKIYMLIFLTSIPTLFVSRFSLNIEQWKWQAVVFFIYYFIFFIFYFFISNEDNNVIEPYIRGIKLSITVQIVYGYVQYISYEFFGFDISNFIFVEKLHLVSKASHYNYSILVPSGLSWHPATFAPILVIGYCFSMNNIILKTFITIIAFLTQSSTCILGIMICILLNYFFNLKNKKIKFKISKISLILVGSFVVIISYLLLFTNLSTTIMDEVIRLFSRASAGGTLRGDISTFYHIRYLTGLGRIALDANIFELLFGIGYGCSGYPFSTIFLQYLGNNPWDVECQFVADLISRGAVGFTITYYWIWKMLKGGSKLDKRYTICIIAFLCQYFTYNICFMWVLVFQMMMCISIKRKINFWEI